MPPARFGRLADKLGTLDVTTTDGLFPHSEPSMEDERALSVCRRQ
jgi:hypothetical protein